MQAVNGSMQQGEAAALAEVQGSRAQIVQGVPGNEPSYVIRCCGFVVHRARSSSA